MAASPPAVHSKIRRSRVALACQRCKKRKQKCDGQSPSCSNCMGFSSTCEYVKPPPVPTTQNRAAYIKAADERIADLERILLKEGIADEGQSRWQQLQIQYSEVTDFDESVASISRRPSKRPYLDYLPNSNDNNGYHGQRTEVTNLVVDVFRDLSLEASGGYIGASSSITMSRMVGSLLRAKAKPSLVSPGFQIEEHLSPKSQSHEDGDEDHTFDFRSMSEEVADKLLRGYLKHISTRWPILHSDYIRSLHSQRGSLVDPCQKGVLHLIYASAGRFLETTGETGAFFPERHHAAGMKHLEELLQCHDIRSGQVLILLAFYSLRAPTGPGAWTYIGLAMRTCIDLGLHRRTPVNKYSILELEMRKRIFWTCYCLDRQISIILGRPFSISDQDIDAELPLDIDESVHNIAVFEAALAASDSTPNDQAPKASTSLSCFIHICRLRRIESRIQQSIYRVDEFSGTTEMEVESFLQQLKVWKENIPSDARQHSADKPSTETDTMVIDGYGYYMVYYHSCIRFLLHPLLLSQNSNPRFLKKCADACGDICQTYKKLHQNIPVGFSLMALHSIFIAGLTLVYCTWLSPQDIFNIKTSNGMNACSIVLYVITERWPGAKKYRDTYESIKQSLLESVEENEYEPRHPLKRTCPNLLLPMTSNEEGNTELTRMVEDMVGRPEIVTHEVGVGPTTNSTQFQTAEASTFRLQSNALDLSVPLEFQQQTSWDNAVFPLDSTDAFNAFDIGDFFMAPTTL